MSTLGHTDKLVIRRVRLTRAAVILLVIALACVVAWLWPRVDDAGGPVEGPPGGGEEGQGGTSLAWLTALAAVLSALGALISGIAALITAWSLKRSPRDRNPRRKGPKRR